MFFGGLKSAFINCKNAQFSRILFDCVWQIAERAGIPLLADSCPQ